MSTHSAAADRTIAQEDLQIPRHLGVIMDGNGRWAKSRGLGRTEGHQAGVDAVRRLVELCIRYRLSCLTIFSFSSENWSRPPEEISFIFGLLRRFVASDLSKLVEQNVRVRVIGARNELEPGLRRIITECEEKTAHNTGLNLIIAFNYGAKAEIVGAVKRIAAQVASGEVALDAVDEDLVASHLDTAGLPDPDLIIRTSGEMRLSNFMLWQAAYAELVFLSQNWPDFDESAFLEALRVFSRRDRRYGGLGR